MVTRSFNLRDVGLLWSLRGQGITLDLQRAVLQGMNPLYAALIGVLPPQWAGTTLTFVCADAERQGRGFVQALACRERREWQVIHLAPWSGEAASSADWVSALVDLCMLAGEWGALRVRAGVFADEAEEVFRQAGFAPYARESVYRLPHPHATAEAGTNMRPVAPSDAWPLVQLLGQTVPSTVQHAEGMTASDVTVPLLARLGISREQGYVLMRGMTLGGYLGLSRDPQGTWARILLQPGLEHEAPGMVRRLVALASPAPVLYCAVRDYQAGLRSVLEEAGFELVDSQVWLVRHTTRPAECRRYRGRTAIDKRTEPVTTPLYPVNNVMARPALRIAREHCVYEYARRDSYAVGPH